VGGLDPGGIEMVDCGTLIEQQPHPARQGQNLVVNQSSREGQRLPNIFVL